MWWKIKNNLFRLFHAQFWTSCKKTDYTFDHELRQRIKKHGVRYEGHDKCIAIIGDWRIWTANYPYCYGHLDDLFAHKGHPYSKVLPAPLTRKMIKDKLDRMDKLDRV